MTWVYAGIEYVSGRMHSGCRVVVIESVSGRRYRVCVGS